MDIRSMSRRAALALGLGALLPGEGEARRRRRRRRKNHHNNNQQVTVPITITVPPSPPGVPPSPPPPDPPCTAPCVVATNTLGARVCVQNTGKSKGSCNGCQDGEQCIPSDGQVVCAASC
jgi:hypothetical protein